MLDTRRGCDKNGLGILEVHTYQTLTPREKSFKRRPLVTVAVLFSGRNVIKRENSVKGEMHSKAQNLVAACSNCLSLVVSFQTDTISY